MKLFKHYNIHWEQGGVYVIRKVSKWGRNDLMKVKLERLNSSVLEFSTIYPTDQRCFMLTKYDFFFGEWEMVEKIS